MGRDTRRARRLGAPSHRVSPFGRVPFFAAKKEPKRRRGRLTSPSGTSSLRLQFVLPRTPVYGGYPYALPQKFRPAVAGDAGRMDTDSSTMAAAGGPQRKAKRSGFALERRSDGMSELCPSGRSEEYAIRDAEDPPAGFSPQRLDPEPSGAPVWSSQSSRLDFGPTAAAARMRGQSLSLPRLTVIGSPLELGPRKFRGSGGGATMGGDAHRSPPPAAFWFLFRRGKRNSPKGRNPARRGAPSRRALRAHGLRRTGCPMGPPFR